MSFNEITRNLEDAGSREQRIRELAESLQRRGLAMTSESARQLAKSMVETERKVQQRYQEKKDEVTAYSFDRNKEPAAIVKNHMEQAVSAPEAPETPEHYPELKPDMMVNEAAQEPAAPELAPEPVAEPTPEPAVEEAPAEDYPVLSEEEDHAAEPGDEDLATGSVPEAPVSDEEVSTEDFADETPTEEAHVEDSDKPEDSEPIPETEEKPREDLGKKLGIDISQMFNVNK
ncbi:hypothetical protein GOV07_00225 [Candidatus Woesearchaeota archaeon]|nr:hypothetical protein [Candidatus Woesearchaeota archaeon]